jgi:hypothetical protein
MHRLFQAQPSFVSYARDYQIQSLFFKRKEKGLIGRISVSVQVLGV